MSEATEAAAIELVKAVTNGTTEVAQYVIGTLAEGHYINGVVGVTIAGIVILVFAALIGLCIKEYKEDNAAGEDTEGDCVAIVLLAFCIIGTLCIGGLFVQEIFAPESVALSQLIEMIDTY